MCVCEYIYKVCYTHIYMAQVATREIKLETIRRSVEECSNHSLGANKEKVTVECGTWWGLRRQSAQELIRELIGNESIVEDNNELWSFEKWEKIKESREQDYLKMQDILKGHAQYTLT